MIISLVTILQIRQGEYTLFSDNIFVGLSLTSRAILHLIF